MARGSRVELTTPFPRLDIKESLLRYGSDKPDLRYDLEITDLGDVLAGHEGPDLPGALDAGGVVRGMRVRAAATWRGASSTSWSTVAKGAGGKGMAWLPGELDRQVPQRPRSPASERATGAGDDDLVLLVADRRPKGRDGDGADPAGGRRRRKLIREDEWKFLWINPTYLFEEDDDGKLTYAHHPFTRPFDEDMSFVDDAAV